MPERKVRGGGRDADAAVEMGLRRYFTQELMAERSVAPEAPMARLPPRQHESGRFKRPAPSWGRAVLANIGFAACFLIVSSASFSYRESHPGSLSRRLALAYADGSLSANAEYVASGLGRAFETYFSTRGRAEEAPGFFNRFKR